MNSEWISPFWQALTLPPRIKVCGVKVMPLSIWHVYALENVGCSLVIGGPVGAGDIVQMIMTATKTRNQYLRMFSSQAKIAAARNTAEKAILRHAYRGGRDPVDESIEYVETCMRIAHRWRKSEGNGRAPSVPHSLHVLRGAVRCGVDYATAWDMPYAQARALFDVVAESMGDQSIMDDIDQQMDEEMSKEVRNG
jgi:hypothetical protein